ncbi:hypothetical protein LRS10_13355 [Phenylobacterium sp. J426]|uniref:hypothetical protein n=1 Tax=Phenylobacterium sp. J426 TaxID=2898439 RepID=UPI00215100C4|nr:hypothetical protein [Phenylobacterium sp. J426]MCR5875082.1 hypothetical protein [Phenylobacterium sp. J426]
MAMQLEVLNSFSLTSRCSTIACAAARSRGRKSSSTKRPPTVLKANFGLACVRAVNTGNGPPSIRE